MIMYPEGPTDEAQVDSNDFNAELLGENELGTVHIHGSFGDDASNVKIAFVIGMHPLESKSHRALFNQLTLKDDLKHSYYIYNINVKDKASETEGRLEGQKLAQEFIKDDIISRKYDLFIDIHSNRGSVGPGKYEISNFIFAPGFDEKSEKIVKMILDDIGEIVYYAPEFRTSPPFITEPTAEAGIPTIVYECFTYESFEKSCDLSLKLIESVENLF